MARLTKLLGVSRREILDFSANINPYGLPDWFRTVVNSALDFVTDYPDPDSFVLRAAAAERYGCSHEEVVVGNGSSELLHHLPRVVKKKRAVIVAPTYVDYVASLKTVGITPMYVMLQEDHGFLMDWEALERALKGDDIVFLCTPNNPTGLTVQTQRLRETALANPSSLFVVDEAFADFVEGMESITSDRPENVIVLLSLTKAFAIPGLRIGLAVGAPDLIRSLADSLPPWSVNSLAQTIGAIALRDSDYIAKSRSFVRQQRDYLQKELASIPALTVYPSTANFLLVKINRRALDARELARRLLRNRIAIRVCDDFAGLDARFFRVAVRVHEENIQLCEAIREALGAPVKRKSARVPPALMFQGTSSNAGKSLMVAAFCRILLQDGYKVAPFKAQNMSLNSFVTSTGGEIGRAQALQAQACRLDPDVRMNPVLLKPTSDVGTQVIVYGKPMANMEVQECIRYKPEAFEVVKRAYDSLSKDFDVMILEGAGSPAEINLRRHDIVNMRMARHAEAKVLIVGDIDKGGVFASFIGTMNVLEAWERAMVAGFVINRFRGDKSLLEPALDYTTLYTGRPILGIVPFLENLGLPDEDSVSFKEGIYAHEAENEQHIELAVIDLPHISNFTDFDAFRYEPDVKLKIIRSLDDLNRPDAVILPGSKNTLGDLHYLSEKGIHTRIRALAQQGIEIVGICGGYQMLGVEIADPHGIESGMKSFAGLNLLNVATVLAAEKTLRRVSGTHIESNLTICGYEIHHGQTLHAEEKPVVRLLDGRVDGTSSPDGRIWGTYVHGIFDADGFRRWFIDKLRKRRGLEPVGQICHRHDIENALDRLAEAVRDSMDIARIYHIIGLA